jgi:DNA repair exonuclease SbcCD ATPase subunit
VKDAEPVKKKQSLHGSLSRDTGHQISWGLRTMDENRGELKKMREELEEIKNQLKGKEDELKEAKKIRAQLLKINSEKDEKLNLLLQKRTFLPDAQLALMVLLVGLIVLLGMYILWTGRESQGAFDKDFLPK